ncbi:hypothetical protein [Oryza sativa Japonica Group]|uniref:Uncharacterized protein n=1 Tax=Oryza sativa subsp. japonica TaxID=39947 RepID=Q5JK00_ORYSJ|nr:hypothetical protein [Oryza sativa Japonica Group]
MENPRTKRWRYGLARRTQNDAALANRMRRRLSRLFKKGSGSSSSASPDVSMEDADVPSCLLNDSVLDLVGERELQVYYMLKDRQFAHT